MEKSRLVNFLDELAPQNAVEQELFLHELLQKYILVALAKQGFFKIAQFHGGTCLRIFEGLQRFSEDLDFVLNRQQDFRWERFFKGIKDLLETENIGLECQDKSKTSEAVQKAFLKTDSFGKVLLAYLPFSRNHYQKIKIKLEIDTNPPEGSERNSKFLDFPTPVSITTQTRESSLSGKLHALLCRPYIKGRDWYDFVWYTNRKIKPNYTLLKNALWQTGPWQNQKINVDQKFLVQALQKKIHEINWKDAVKDVERFLIRQAREDIEVWGTEYFDHILNQWENPNQ